MVKKILYVIGLIICIVVGCYGGRMYSSLDLIKKDTKGALSNVDLGDIDITQDQDIINILILGSDARSELGSEKWGRSDTCMVATIDNKHKLLKLTSIMRDCELEVPDYGHQKFNAAFSYGGPELVYKTLANNFGLSLDGYVIIDFEAFVDIVDAVGGVDIELTDTEANYLNHTNYIRVAEYRNVQPGWNTLNGEQALGYCRVRKVSNINGTANDQGRTERQRMVLEGVFEKVKGMSKTKWMGILDTVLPNVTTDISNTQIISYATNVVTMGTTEINQYRIPVEGYYGGGTSEYGNGSVLKLDLESNKQLLQEFIYDYDGTTAVPGSTTEAPTDTTESAGE